MSDRWIRLSERPLDTARAGALSLSERTITRPGAEHRLERGLEFGRSRALELFNRFNDGSRSLSDSVTRLNLPGDRIARAFSATHDWTEHPVGARSQDMFNDR
jgi:hypothetical protein